LSLCLHQHSLRAERRLHLWGSQLDLLEGMETGELCGFFPRGTGSMLHLSSSKEVDVETVYEYKDLLEVVIHAVAKLNIDWSAEKQAEQQQSKLDQLFLCTKLPPPRRSLPFFPDLHTEVSRSWNKSFLACLFIPTSDNYGNVAGMAKHEYRAMPRVEQTLASYLLRPCPFKPLCTTSALVGKGYTAAGQAGACLHTMSVSQPYQADLLKELDEGEEIKADDISELRRNTDLSLHATKETARAIGGHLWLTLSDMKEKDRVFLLDAPLAPSGLYQKALKQAVALVRPFPAGQPLQGTELAPHTTPEASLERQVPLVDYLAVWKLLPNVSAWVLHTVERGYRIQFGAPPLPFNGVSSTLVGPEQGLVMEQEVATLLGKEAIDRESGFYSRYFIVPKKDGGLRPILDLHLKNCSIMRLKFKMLTVKQVMSQIRSEDWFVTIDLKDGYFHVSILPHHRKFLRFAFRCEAYQYRVLPFSLALLPRTFTKCVDAALAPLGLQGIRKLNYIDDWLIVAQSFLSGGISSHGGGHHPSPPPGAVEAVGVAPEGAQLIASSLFISWCGHRQQDPVNCPVGTVLEFLQDRFSAELTHSTLKVYVAAIVAYHAPLGGLSVGKNPLVTRFLCGALR
ncbi:hypothetical protein M9458_018467, partial [Cirrhinus mrigala]